jgi:PH (Pleckstrin Homology) domain-containing protein
MTIITTVLQYRHGSPAPAPANPAGWEHGRVASPQTIRRFRHSPAVTIAAVIAAIGWLSVATWQPYLLVLLLIPLGVAIWSWRAGTDVDADGITVRAALGHRRVPWSQVSGLETDQAGHVLAILSSGGRLTLTAVGTRDLPAVVAATGQRLGPGRRRPDNTDAPAGTDEGTDQGAGRDDGPDE